MFTGIITAKGKIHSLSTDTGGSDRQLCIQVGTGFDLARQQIGDSIAVSGVCLTIVEKTIDSFSADVSAETLACTTLGEYRSGTRVNLEPALRAGDPLGGHLVSGHVDARIELLEKNPCGTSSRMLFSLPAELAGLVAAKGSICVDGVSLTVNRVYDEPPGSGFEVNVIPHTLSHTTLGEMVLGERVNIEIDPLARYMARLLEFHGNLGRSARPEKTSGK